MNLQVRLGLAVAATPLSACVSTESAVFSTTLEARNASGEEPGEFGVGEQITLAMTSANQTDEAQPITWCAGGRFDFLVYAHNGTLVWNVYHDRVFTAALQPDVYGAREERSGSLTWSQTGNDGDPVPPGAYYAVIDGCAYRNEVRIAGFRSAPVDFLIRAP